MRKVIDRETGHEPEKFIGAWYDGQCFPQRIFLEISGENKTYCITYSDDDGIPVDVFNDLTLRFFIEGAYVLSPRESEKILADHKELIEKLLDTFETGFCNGNYGGKWDENLKYELEKSLFDLYFDDPDYEFCEEDDE
jgi:hypothetical protein